MHTEHQNALSRNHKSILNIFLEYFQSICIAFQKRDEDTDTDS